MTDSEVLHAYLKCRGVKMSLSYLHTLLLTHPDFPTLMSFVDTLEGLGIDCYAAKFEKDNFNEIDYPFLAVTPERANIFKIIYTEEQLLNNHKNILQAWNGMALFVEDGAVVKDIDYKESNFIEKRLTAFTWGYLILLSVLLLVFLGSKINNSEYILFLTVSLIGLGLSLIIIQHKNTADNSIFNAICNAPKSINCNLVLSSGLSSIKKVPLADLSLVYFLVVIFYTFLSGANVVLVLAPVFCAAIFTLVLLGYQKLVIKTWCRICLAITGVIWVQVITLTLFFVNQPDKDKIGLDAILLFLFSILISSSYFFMKPYLMATEKLKEDKINLLKWKRDPLFFFLLLKQQTKIDYQNDIRTDIFFGNRNSAIQLIVILKPFCTLCAASIKAIYKLYNSSAIEMGITVRFAINPTRLDDRRSVAVLHIINEYNKNKDEWLLVEWFKEMNLKKWEAKYKFSPTAIKEESINRYATFIDTPVIFINGYKLPAQYDISDLKLLLPHFPQLA